MWAELYLGEGRAPARLVEAARADLYAHTLLLAPDLPWVPDGTRDRPDLATHEWFFERLKYWLTTVGRPYEVISGAPADREAYAVAVVERVLSSPR